MLLHHEKLMRAKSLLVCHLSRSTAVNGSFIDGSHNIDASVSIRKHFWNYYVQTVNRWPFSFHEPKSFGIARLESLRNTYIQETITYHSKDYARWYTQALQWKKSNLSKGLQMSGFTAWRPPSMTFGQEEENAHSVEEINLKHTRSQEMKLHTFFQASASFSHCKCNTQLVIAIDERRYILNLEDCSQSQWLQLN